MITKRYNMPKFWPLRKKAKAFAISPMPGPHPKNKCIPLGIIIRDILGYAETMKEAVYLLNQGIVKVDGIVRKDPAFPSGIMDIVSVGDESYRIIPSSRGLSLSRTGDKTKLLMIRNKSCVSGRIQLNMHDGKNILTDNADLKTGDVLAIDVESRQIKNTLRMKKGCAVMITEGSNMGKVGSLEAIVPQRREAVISLGGREISIKKDFLFVVGDSEPVINIGDKGEGH